MLKILPIKKIYQLRNKCSNTGILTSRKYSQTRNTTNAEMFPALKITNNEILQHRNITNIETLPKAKIISSEVSPSTKCHQPRNIT